MISPSVLNEILPRYSNLGCRFFFFSILNIPCQSLLVCRVSAERSAVKCMGFPLYVTCCFSLAAFNILSLYLVFVSLISMCLGMFLLGFILYEIVYSSWNWLTVSFPTLEKFLTIIYSKFFSNSSFYILLLDSYNFNGGAFNIVPEVSETILSYFHSFSFILLINSYFHHSNFQLIYLFFCFRYYAIGSF